MPFSSKKQQRFAYANPEKFGGKKGLKEWSDATDFSKLPEKVKKKKKKKKEEKACKKSIYKLPILKSEGGISGMTTTSGGEGLITVGQGSYPEKRKRKKNKKNK